MQEILLALRDQAVVRECCTELPLPEPNHGQRLAVLFWLLLAMALIGLLAADWLVSGAAERRW